MIAFIATAFVALLHLWIFVLESFLWAKPVGRRVFGLTPELAQATRVLAANQGVYNLFLAAGLIWGLSGGGIAVRVFFLGCVIVAGVVGGFTAKRSILWVQAMPAAIALALTLL
jgi:putative membrane protein